MSSTMQWHSYPEALYTIKYSYEGLSTEFSVESLSVDASTFIAVEDFAKATCPEGWEVTGIEKSYYDYARMYGGDDGKWIDIRLNENSKEFPVEFLGYNRHLKEATIHNAEVVLKRKQHLRKVAKLYEETRTAR